MSRKAFSISLFLRDFTSRQQALLMNIRLSIFLKCFRSTLRIAFRIKRAQSLGDCAGRSREEENWEEGVLGSSGGGGVNLSRLFWATRVTVLSRDLSIQNEMSEQVYNQGSTMLRKNIRQRREYLFGLAQERESKEKASNLHILQKANETNSTIPTELYREKDQLQEQLKKHDQNTMVPRNRMDDEYANTLYSDPQLLITTSRDPTNRLQQFAKELSILLPNATRINRGGTVMAEIAELGLRKGATDIVMLHEHRGQPDGLIVSHLPVGPTLYFGLQNVVLRHDVEEKLQTMPEVYPHLIFHDFKTDLGERVKTVLQHLFPVAKPDSRRIVTFANQNDVISFRHHTYEKVSHKEVGLTQLGPRFELKLYQISLGLVHQTESTKEWVLRPYMNTASKRQAL